MFRLYDTTANLSQTRYGECVCVCVCMCVCVVYKTAWGLIRE